MHDISDQRGTEADQGRLLEQSQREHFLLADVFRQAPAFMCVLRGPAHIFELSNDQYDQLVGHRDLLGLTVREAFPELEGQGFFELLDEVYATGESFVGSGMRVMLNRERGQPAEERYIDLVYQALQDPRRAITGIVVVGVDVTDRQRADERLRSSEEHLRLALDAAGLGAWHIDAGSNTLSSDERFQVVFSGRVGPITFEEALARVHPDDRNRIHDEVSAAMRPDQPVPYSEEYRVVHLDGSTRWVHGKGRAIFEPTDAGQRMVRLDGTVMDITARKEAEEQLRQSNQFNRSLMDGTADCVKVLDLDGRLLHMNTPGLCAMEIDDFGSVFGQEWEEIWPADARVDIDRSVARAVCGDVSSFQAYCPTAKGTPKWWEVTVSPVRDAEGGRVVRLLAVSRDITERKQVEQALRDSETRLRVATAAVSELIWTNNADGLMEGEQSGWGNFTGQSREEYEGHGWSNAIHPDDAQPTIDEWNRAVVEKRPFIFDHRVRRRDGEWRLCSVRAMPILTADGMIQEWVGVHADITERKRDEEKLRQLAADLSEADHRKDEFLATLAHELRNPLAPIRNGLQLIKLAGGQPATLERARSMMERQLTQMVRLVDDLMDVSRISLGKLELRKERLVLATVLNSAVETSRPLIGQMGHELSVRLPEQPIMVDADLTRLAQVFLNLLNNAAKYSDRGGHIRLNAELQGSDVVVTVTDTGIGIDADHLPRIFTMFTQLGGALERSQGGLGIGLTLVKRLVDMHGGSVEAKSAGLGLGSEFVVRLPVLIEASPPQACGPDDEPAATKSSLRILIVDDNRDGADSLSEMLQMMGNDTRTAYDGQLGVELAGEYRPDVILLDIGLPKLNGYEACRLIREQPKDKGVVLIAVTGWGQDADRRRAHEAGFDHHMVKPVDPQALMRMLDELNLGHA